MKKLKLILMYVMAFFYVLAGINHFRNPEVYMSIMPNYLPYHYALVIISGIFELALGVLLLFKQTRQWAAWGIILLLIAVFPANIQMAIDFYQIDHPYLWLALVRLPLQLVLIWWAYIYTKKESSSK